MHIKSNPHFMARSVKSASTADNPPVSKIASTSQEVSVSVSVVSVANTATTEVTPTTLIPPSAISTGMATATADSSKLNTRLKEMFKERITAFREAVYLLTGYKVSSFFSIYLSVLTLPLSLRNFSSRLIWSLQTPPRAIYLACVWDQCTPTTLRTTFFSRYLTCFRPTCLLLYLRHLTLLCVVFVVCHSTVARGCARIAGYSSRDQTRSKTLHLSHHLQFSSSISLKCHNRTVWQPNIPWIVDKFSEYFSRFFVSIKLNKINWKSIFYCWQIKNMRQRERNKSMALKDGVDKTSTNHDNSQ